MIKCFLKVKNKLKLYINSWFIILVIMHKCGEIYCVHKKIKTVHVKCTQSIVLKNAKCRTNKHENVAKSKVKPRA